MENIQDIDIKRLELNKGQVEGLPKNPRFIRDERYKALVKSIEDAPEMLKLRELLPCSTTSSSRSFSISGASSMDLTSAL